MTLKPAWYMNFAEGHSGNTLDKIGGLPSHIPDAFPRYEPTDEELAFIAQIYCTTERLAIPGTLCIQLYQEIDYGPLPVAIRVPVGAKENTDQLGLIHPRIRKYEIHWEQEDDPETIPDDWELTEKERRLMQSKVGGTPHYTDDDLEIGHRYLFQMREDPAGFNFAGRHAIVTIDADGLLDVRLQ